MKNDDIPVYLYQLTPSKNWKRIFEAQYTYLWLAYMFLFILVPLLALLLFLVRRLIQTTYYTQKLVQELYSWFLASYYFLLYQAILKLYHVTSDLCLMKVLMQQYTLGFPHESKKLNIFFCFYLVFFFFSMTLTWKMTAIVFLSIAGFSERYSFNDILKFLLFIYIYHYLIPLTRSSIFLNIFINVPQYFLPALLWICK